MTFSHPSVSALAAYLLDRLTSAARAEATPSEASPTEPTDDVRALLLAELARLPAELRAKAEPTAPRSA